MDKSYDFYKRVCVTIVCSCGYAVTANLENCTTVIETCEECGFKHRFFAKHDRLSLQPPPNCS